MFAVVASIIIVSLATSGWSSDDPSTVQDTDIVITEENYDKEISIPTQQLILKGMEEYQNAGTLWSFWNTDEAIEKLSIAGRYFIDASKKLTESEWISEKQKKYKEEMIKWLDIYWEVIPKAILSISTEDTEGLEESIELFESWSKILAEAKDILFYVD